MSKERITKREAREAGFCRDFCIHGKKKGAECIAMNSFRGIPEDEWMKRIKGGNA